MTKSAHHCPSCEFGYLIEDVRDVQIDRQAHSVIVRNVRGLFCDQCAEVEISDCQSARRYLAAADRLAFRSAISQKWESLIPTRRLAGKKTWQTLVYLISDSLRSYFAPVHMGRWLLLQHGSRLRGWATGAHFHCRTSRVDCAGARTARSVLTRWDPAVNVWVAQSDDIVGLATEAATLAELSVKLKTLVPALLLANGAKDGAVPFRMTIRHCDLPYAPDDGPLSDEQIAALRADVMEHFPRSKLISRKSLFE